MRSPFDDFLSKNEHEQLELKHEQNRDSTIQKIVDWVRGRPIGNLSYSSFELRKYAKNLPHLVLKFR